MAWTPGNPIPEKGNPSEMSDERYDYNHWRWGNKKSPNQPIPNRYHEDRPEFEAYLGKRQAKTEQAKSEIRKQRKISKDANLVAASAENNAKINKIVQDTNNKYYPSGTPRLSVFSLDPENPSAKNAVNYDSRHGDLMHQIGLKLDAAVQKHEDESIKAGKFPHTDYISKHIADGFQHLVAHSDAHLAGNAAIAKGRIKAAAASFSTAAKAAHEKFGLNKVLVGNVPAEKQPESAKSLGELAVATANAYINSNRVGMGGSPLPGKGNTNLVKFKTNYTEPKFKPEKGKPYFQEMNERAAARTAQTPSESVSKNENVGTQLREYIPRAGFFPAGTSSATKYAQKTPKETPETFSYHRKNVISALARGESVPEESRIALGEAKLGKVVNEYKSYVANKASEAADETISRSRNDEFGAGMEK